MKFGNKFDEELCAFFVGLTALLMVESASTPVLVTPEAAMPAADLVAEQPDTYEDLLGRFRVPIPTNWTDQEMGKYVCEQLE